MTSLETSTDQEDLIGGKYRLGPVIGSGGIATVRRATHVWTEREVAVKLLDPTLPHFEQLRAGFLREARATVQLDHPNVVDVLDMGEDGWDTAYLVMELLHGPTLRDVLLERGKLSEEDTLAILLPLLDALEKAHELGIIHRDFKPDNIMLPLDAYGVVTPKLLDFGIAEVLRDARSGGVSDPEGVIMGTPQYMSPEQARDHRALIGPQTDVWGVAIVWYECLTGIAPFDGDSAEEILHAVCEKPIDFSAVPERYVPVLRAALHRLPGFRMASIPELKARIEAMGFDRTTIAPAASSLSSVPAAAPAATHLARKPTLAGLGPDQLFPPSPSPAGVHSEVITLPIDTNRRVWLAGLALAAAVAFAAWWTVRDPGYTPGSPSDAAIAQPWAEELAPTPDREESEAEVPTAPEELGAALATAEELAAAPTTPDELVVPPTAAEELVAPPTAAEELAEASTTSDDPAVAATSSEDPAAAPAIEGQLIATAPEDGEPEPAAEEQDGSASENQEPALAAEPEEPAASAAPEPPPAKVKPARRKPKRAKPKPRPQEAPKADDSQTQKPPDLVTEW
ncbi:MAG: protein kinase domain-containing protein [Polyangiales bacterium]